MIHWIRSKTRAQCNSIAHVAHKMMLSIAIGNRHAIGCLISKSGLRNSVCGALLDKAHRGNDDTKFGGWLAQSKHPAFHFPGHLVALGDPFWWGAARRSKSAPHMYAYAAMFGKNHYGQTSAQCSVILVGGRALGDM